MAQEIVKTKKQSRSQMKFKGLTKYNEIKIENPS
jgi:hypothetical protein